MRSALMVVIYLLPMAFSIWSIVRLFRNRRQSFLYQLQRGFGWLALCVSPFPFLQIFKWANGSSGLFSAGDIWAAIALVPGSWMVLMGGQSVIHVFEANVKNWTGHRRDTMFDNMDVFFALVATQILILSLLVGWRLMKEKTLRDPVVVGVGIFMAVNAAMAMNWMWFGT